MLKVQSARSQLLMIDRTWSSLVERYEQPIVKHEWIVAMRKLQIFWFVINSTA